MFIFEFEKVIIGRRGTNFGLKLGRGPFDIIGGITSNAFVFGINRKSNVIYFPISKVTDSVARGLLYRKTSKENENVHLFRKLT